MKKIFLLSVLAIPCLYGFSQNPYANKTFYDAFNKVYSDRENAFGNTKGTWLRDIGIFYSVYKANTLLPGADSANVTIPSLIGSPSATYSFKVSKSWIDIKTREGYLLNAINTALGKKMVIVQKTDSIKQFVYYRTYYFENDIAAKYNNYILYTYIVFDAGTYHLDLNIAGMNLPQNAKQKLPDEPSLDSKILSLLSSMDKFFADQKGKQLSTNQYYTEYESNSTLFGQKMTMKDRQYEASLSFYAGSMTITGPGEAKEIFTKLKAAFTSSGRYIFKPENLEGSRTWIYGGPANASVKNRYSLILEYYNDTYSPSVSFLLTISK